MDWNNFRFARRSLLNERNRLLSPSILQIAEAGDPDAKHAGRSRILCA
jgi:hypothetical protein